MGACKSSNPKPKPSSKKKIPFVVKEKNLSEIQKENATPKNRLSENLPPNQLYSDSSKISKANKRFSDHRTIKNSRYKPPLREKPSVLKQINEQRVEKKGGEDDWLKQMKRKVVADVISRRGIKAYK